MTGAQHALVPVEPTPEMLRAGFHADDLATAWAVMLAAAPAVQPAAGREVYNAIVTLQAFLDDFDNENLDAIEADDFNIGQDEYIEVPSATLRRVLTALAPAQQGEAEPVGRAKTMAGVGERGVTIATFKASDVPDGAYLYAHPPAQASENGGEARRVLELIADGWGVIESSGSMGEMTLQAPAHWNEPGETEIVFSFAALSTPAQASEGVGEMLARITQALVRADEEFGNSLSAYRYRKLAEAVAALSAPQAAPGEGEQS